MFELFGEAMAGRYEDLSLLDTQGGQGLACRAFSTDKIEVALKLYDARFVRERTDREVAALRQLRSDRIVRLHDAGEVVLEGQPYRFIATEFVHGESLAKRLLSGPVPVPEALQIASDVAEAVDALWRKRIVHRDIKPDNIIVHHSGRAVLIDLGIARHLSQKALTTTGHTFGTLGYCAPEHLAGRPLTCRADIFAAGIVLQEMLVGAHPTAGHQNLLSAGGPPTARLIPVIAADLASLVDRMVAFKQYDRPKPLEVVALIEKLLLNGRKD
jgi:serine/threonine-protein kinase